MSALPVSALPVSTLAGIADRARTAARDADAAVRREAGRQVLDVLGCLASGASHPLAGTWLPLVGEDPGGVRLPGVPGRRRPEDAAEVGGVLAHLDELDPLHAPSAMGAGMVVVPTVLALAAGRDVAGTRLARAVVAGYEAAAETSLRFGGPALYATGRWPTALFGPLGAAAAAAELLDLDGDATTTALALAATSLGGLLSADVLGHGHYLLGGTAARTGLRAALGARAGLTASTTLLDGPAATALGRSPGPPSSTTRPHLLATGSKRWPCSRPLQSALAALDDLARRGVRPGAGDVVTVALPGAARAFVTDTDAPDDATTAAASATVAVRGHAVGRSADPGWYRDVAAGTAHGPAITVRLTGSADLDAAFPARWGAHVTLDGATATCLVPPGDPAAPLSDDALLARTAALTGTGREHLAGWLDVAAVDDVRALTGGAP